MSTPDPDDGVLPSPAARYDVAPGAFVDTAVPSRQIESSRMRVVVLHAGSSPSVTPSGGGGSPGDTLLPSGWPANSRLSAPRCWAWATTWNVLPKTGWPTGTSNPVTGISVTASELTARPSNHEMLRGAKRACCSGVIALVSAAGSSS